MADKNQTLVQLLSKQTQKAPSRDPRKAKIEAVKQNGQTALLELLKQIDTEKKTTKGTYCL
jgi:histidinol dehydrogenase